MVAPEFYIGEFEEYKFGSCIEAVCALWEEGMSMCVRGGVPKSIVLDLAFT